MAASAPQPRSTRSVTGLILLLVFAFIVGIGVTVAAWKVGIVFLFFTAALALVVAGVWLVSRQTPGPPESESSEWQPKPRTRDPEG